MLCLCALRMTYSHIDNLQDAIAALEQRDAKLAEQQLELARIQKQLDWLQRQVFGPKSEKRGAEDAQDTLFEDTDWAQEQQKKPEPEREEEEIRYKRTKPAGKRKPLPEELERQQIIHDVPESQKYCPHTGKRLLKWIGQEVAEQLAYQPPVSFVIQHVQHKYVREEENLDGSQPEVVTAPKPQEGLPKCAAAPSLLAAVAVSKYADHIPLYRLERMLKRCNITAARSSMCRWMRDGAAMLEVIVALMEASLLRSGTIQGDDTPSPQQDPGRGKTKTCRFWSYVGDGVTGGRYVVFRYTTDRSRDGPEGFFTDEHGNARFHGNLQCDAYAGFGRLFERGSKWGMTEIGCWAHARRKFYDSRKDAPGESRWVRDKISRMYRVEARGKAWNLSEQQWRELRARWEKPIVDELFGWCEKNSNQVLPKSKLSAAIEYVRNRGEALRRYLYDGNLEIDNNTCERTIRAIALGRKNWLFTGSEAGGRTAAVFFSLIGSCHLHGVDPLAYLTDVITRLPQTPEDQLEQFLPDRWSPPKNETDS